MGEVVVVEIMEEGGGFGGDFEQDGETDPQPPGPFDDPWGGDSSESNYQKF